MRSPLGAIIDAVTRTRSDPPVPFSSERPNGIARFFQQRVNADALMASYVHNGTLHSIVSLLAETQAAIKWSLWRTARSGRVEDREQVTSHLALDLWNKPNAFTSGQGLIEVSQQHIDLVGECDWVVERTGNARLRGTEAGSIPLGLWPVRPDRIEPVPSADHGIIGWMYHGPDGDDIPLGLDEVIATKRPNPLDPGPAGRGLGPVQSILVHIDSARYSAEWNRRFFTNDATPGGIIEIPNSLGDVEFERLRRRWQEQHQGVANAHRVALLEQAKWVTTTFNQKDMQFVELQSVGRDIIRESFRMHQHMLGGSDDVNRANAEAAEYSYAKRQDVPRAERLKGTLNHLYLPMFGAAGKGLEFDYASPVPEDVEGAHNALQTKAEAAAALRGAGWNPDDILTAVGLPPMRHDGAPALPGGGA